MKTKHKLKLLKQLRFGTEYDLVLKGLMSELKEVCTIEPIQETKDPEPERFEIGEEVEVIGNKNGHKFAVGEKVTITNRLNTNVFTYYDGRHIWHILYKDIKKLPKQTINKEELRKHICAVHNLWSSTEMNFKESIDYYFETL